MYFIVFQSKNDNIIQTRKKYVKTKKYDRAILMTKLMSSFIDIESLLDFPDI